MIQSGYTKLNLLTFRASSFPMKSIGKGLYFGVQQSAFSGRQLKKLEQAGQSPLRVFLNWIADKKASKEARASEIQEKLEMLKDKSIPELYAEYVQTHENYYHTEREQKGTGDGYPYGFLSKSQMKAKEIYRDGIEALIISRLKQLDLGLLGQSESVLDKLDSVIEELGQHRTYKKVYYLYPPIVDRGFDDTALTDAELKVPKSIYRALLKAKKRASNMQSSDTVGTDRVRKSPSIKDSEDDLVLDLLESNRASA